MLISAVIGIALKCAEDFLRRERMNPFMSILLCSVVGGFLAISRCRLVWETMRK